VFRLRTVTFTIAFGDRWSGDLTMAAIEQNAREGFETLYVRDIVLQPVPCGWCCKLGHHEMNCPARRIPFSRPTERK